MLPHGKFGKWRRPDEFRHDHAQTLDVLNLMHKLYEQFLTSFESTIIKVWKDDVKNVLGTGTKTVPHLDYLIDRTLFRDDDSVLSTEDSLSLTGCTA
jgi:hypothetical protein